MRHRTVSGCRKPALEETLLPEQSRRHKNGTATLPFRHKKTRRHTTVGGFGDQPKKA